MIRDWTVIACITALTLVGFGAVGAAKPRHQGMALDDETLSRIRGLDDNSLHQDSGLACAYLTADFSGGQTTVDGCAGKPNGTVCIGCEEARGRYARIPGTTGGDRITSTGVVLQCNTRIKKSGTCFAGVCGNITSGGVCSGAFSSYEDQ